MKRSSSYNSFIWYIKQCSCKKWVPDICVEQTTFEIRNVFSAKLFTSCPWCLWLNASLKQWGLYNFLRGFSFTGTFFHFFFFPSHLKWLAYNFSMPAMHTFLYISECTVHVAVIVFKKKMCSHKNYRFMGLCQILQQVNVEWEKNYINITMSTCLQFITGEDIIMQMWITMEISSYKQPHVSWSQKRQER